MININPLLRDLPSCIHSVLDTFHDTESIQIFIKEDNSKVTQLDIELQRRLQDLLAHHFPAFHSWGEESFVQTNTNPETLLEKGPCWVIDPLDGTTNFIHNIPNFCTILSLIVDGEVIAGIIYDPNRKECFHALKSTGVFYNQQRVSVPKKYPKTLKESVIALDDDRLEENLRKYIINQQPYYSQRNFGAAGIDWAWLSINRFHVYLHGSQNLWDYASGLLFIKELGGVVTDLHGKDIKPPLSLEKQATLASLSPALHEAWLNILYQARIPQGDLANNSVALGDP